MGVLLEKLMVDNDLSTFDNSLKDSYTSHSSGGKTIRIVYNTFIPTIQWVVAVETHIIVSRAFSKTKSVFVFLYKASTGERALYSNKMSNFWSSNAGNAKAALATTHREEPAQYWFQSLYYSPGV